MKPQTKAYLGDGVYAEASDFGGLVLTTENGISITTIVLEEEVVCALLAYIKRQGLK